MTPDQYRREGFRLGIEAAANEWQHVKVEGGRAMVALLAYEARIRAIDVDKVMSGIPTAPDAVARLVEAAEFFDRRRKSIEDDVSSGHSGRGPGASSWMREDDRDFFLDLRNAFDALSIALAACKGVRDAS